MTRRRCGLLSLGMALLFWAIGGEWLSIRAGVPENHFLDALPGLSFLLAGLVALDQRPRSRIGWLMIAFVIVWFLGNWGLLRVPVAAAIGTSVGTQLTAPVLGHMSLAYPTGRLRTRYERVVTSVIYGVFGLACVAILLVFDPRANGCSRCSWEPAPFPSWTAYQTVQLVAQRLSFVMVLLFLSAVWLRWRRETPAGRRVLAPLWVGVCVICAVDLAGAFASPDEVAQPFAYLVYELQTVLYVCLALVYLWGLLSARLARSAVGDLVMELDKPLPPGDLCARLAHALADPSLELLYARDSLDGWVDADGQPRTLPEPAGGQPTRSVTIAGRDGHPLAALVHDPALDQQLVRAAAAAAGMAIENEQLQAEVRAQLEEVRASRQRIVETGDAERRRVERNIHDGAQQRMATLALLLAMIRERAVADPAMAASLDQAATELRQAIAELRDLARGIHPAILTEEGLSAAVEALADRSAQPVRVLADFDERLPGPVEATAYFVVAEALANVTKHACASGARVELSRRNGTLRVTVTDDGVGGADPSRGSGLRGLEDQVCAVRGSFLVVNPPEGGTQVLAEIPCDA